MKGRLHIGDNAELLADLPDCSVDACVTDPPAGIAFMQKSWDDATHHEPRTEVGRRVYEAAKVLQLPKWAGGFCTSIADTFSEVHRVLKPGAHAVVWAIPRTAGPHDAGASGCGF